MFDINDDGAINLDDVRILLQNEKYKPRLLKGDGDFRSKECIELLKESDIVVTNPPFSLFREYVAQLIAHEKKFVVIGPRNAITYKEIFPLIKHDIIWLGYGFNHGDAYFKVPEDSAHEYAEGVYDAATGLVHFRNCTWFTNLDIDKRHESIPLYKKFTPEEFPRYDDYDAVEVSKTSDIPYDYDGIMGVPITFLDRYNPDQFEIMGLDDHRVEWRGRGPSLNGKCKYRRIIIRRKR